LVEVGGDQVRRLYDKPYGESRSPVRGKNDEPFSTVAFFGLAGEDVTLWAAGIDGIDAGGTARIVPLPQFEDLGDISVSFDFHPISPLC
jgi:hypothetical protein